MLDHWTSPEATILGCELLGRFDEMTDFIWGLNSQTENKTV